MSDYDGWDGEVGASVADANHAAHKPLTATHKKRSPKKQKESARLIGCLRAAVGIGPAEPKHIDTTNIEAELKTHVIVERSHA